MNLSKALEFKKKLIAEHPTAMKDIEDLEDAWREGKWVRACFIIQRLVTYGLEVHIDENGPKVQMHFNE